MSDLYHIPALLDEAVKGLDIKPDGVFVDATFGGGGHSAEIIKLLGSNGHLFGFDQDLDAGTNAIKSQKFTFVHSNFRFMKNFLGFYGIDKVDGILADLGVSFHHFDEGSRGFSFRSDAGLDMRMNRNASLTARQVINEYPADLLTRIFKVYGEMDNSRRIADKIVAVRKETPINSTQQLADIIGQVTDKRREKKELAKAFQAVRIEVNKELEALETLLKQSVRLIKPGGRLAIITYHSLEDRMVKNFFKTGNLEGKSDTDIFGRNLSPFKAINTKPIVPSEKEIEQNPRSRSAKLRIAERL